MDEMHSSPTAPGLVDGVDELDLDISSIRRRRDGVYLVDSNGETVLSLTTRQLMFVLAVAHAERGHNVRRNLRDIAFPNRPRMQLRQAAGQGGASSAPIPMSPAERASLCRTLRRLEEIGLIETYGRTDIEPTDAALEIAVWVDDHPAMLEDDDLLAWARDP